MQSLQDRTAVLCFIVAQLNFGWPPPTALCVGRPIKVPCQMCRPFYCPREAEAEAAAVKQKGTEKSRDGEGEGGVCRK